MPLARLFLKTRCITARGRSLPLRHKYYVKNGAVTIEVTAREEEEDDPCIDSRAYASYRFS